MISLLFREVALLLSALRRLGSRYRDDEIGHLLPKQSVTVRAKSSMKDETRAKVQGYRSGIEWTLSIICWKSSSFRQTLFSIFHRADQPSLISLSANSVNSNRENDRVTNFEKEMLEIWDFPFWRITMSYADSLAANYRLDTCLIDNCPIKLH